MPGENETSISFTFEPTPALLTGRTVIVTGANTGLGLDTAIHLARLEPEQLILAVRTVSKGEKAKATIAERSGLEVSKIAVWELDLASFDSTKAFATRAVAELPRLDVLVENAGLANFKWVSTPDGWEEQLQVNGLSTGLLAVSLLPLLAETAALPVEGVLKHFTPHLTIVGSSVHGWWQYKPTAEGKALLDDFNDPDSANGEIGATGAPVRYNFSKLVSNHLAHGIAKLKLAERVIVDVANPGLCASELTRTAPDEIKEHLRSMSITTEEGSKNIAWAATEEFTEKGVYVDEMKVVVSSEWSMSAEGLDFERQFFGEMSELWVKLDPKLKDILA